ncbi:MAG: hydantoinase/oxoprolinase family protein [Planctomycetota bacterium]|nr:hydantoinase/oxoprolinase family protein [Planctomycetota bacterium]
MGIIVGVDIGGTFTDLVAFDEENKQLRVDKVPSTPDDSSRGLIHGLEALALSGDSIELVVHATTVATNAVLQRKGARCGLITTRGFRDILELRRRDRPHAYGLYGTFTPLVPRDRRLEVTERITAEGTILTPLRQSDLLDTADKLIEQKVDAIVVSFLNSYSNPDHELQAKQWIQQQYPDLFVVSASEVLPVYREFERTSTAVLNAYVQPLIARYLCNLEQRLEQRGYTQGIQIMQSNGGTLTSNEAQTFPVKTILSGPAAGVIAATRLAGESGFNHVITYDMGGTSLDVALVTEGKPYVTGSAELSFGIPVQMTMIDIQTIGAGGGSIAQLDGRKMLQIGPESAGAHPGPACYNQGGTLPTVTDANLILGRINPEKPIGGKDRNPLDATLSQSAIREHVATPLGLSIDEAASAVLSVANNRMAGSLRRITIDRGHDPRDFILFAFGGAGPLFICSLLRELGATQGMVPRFPGITSAWGCVCSDIQHDFVEMVNRPLDQVELSTIESVFSDQQEQGRKRISDSRLVTDALTTIHEAEMSFEGQTHVIRTMLPNTTLSHKMIRQRFLDSFQRRYGQIDDTFEGLDTLLSEIPVRILTLRTSVIGVRPIKELRSFLNPPDGTLQQSVLGTRDVYHDQQYYPCPIYDRTKIPWEQKINGPAVIEQLDTTTWLEPDTSAQIDNHGNLLIEVP